MKPNEPSWRRARIGAFVIAMAAGVTLTASCGAARDETAETPHAKAATVAEQVLDELIDRTPAMGRGLGMHAYDGKLSDYSKKGIAERRAWLLDARARLEKADGGPSDDGKLDLGLMKLTIAQELFRIDDMAEQKKRPTYYEELFTVDGYLTREYAPLDTRAARALEHVEKALTQVPHIEENLEGPMSKPVLETAVKIYRGYAEYLEGDALTILAPMHDKKLHDEVVAAFRKLAKEATRIADHLEKDELPRGDASHVLGVERYEKLLRVQEALDMPLDELERMGEANLAENKKAYEELAEKVKPTRPPATALLGEATKLTEKAKRFIVEKHLVTIPDADRIQVRETPPFMRYNSAFLDGPGPFDKPDLPAFYYISPPDPKWSQKEQDDYIMPFGTLLATSVHEVYPGHYLQGMWIRKAPTKIEQAIGSYSFIEGWAHYGEQLMIEQGFGGDDPQNHLGQLGDALLRNCRVQVSIGVHTKGMTLEAAAKRFEEDCKQDAATAKEQAVRATFDPGYFAYTLGKIQILALREEAKKQLGAAFDLQAFHDALLAHGSPPVPMIHDRVLADLTAHAKAQPAR